MYLFEIKKVRRITLFWGNDLATVPIAVVCFTCSGNSYIYKYTNIIQDNLEIGTLFIITIDNLDNLDY